MNRLLDRAKSKLSRRTSVVSGRGGEKEEEKKKEDASSYRDGGVLGAEGGKKMKRKMKKEDKDKEKEKEDSSAAPRPPASSSSASSTKRNDMPPPPPYTTSAAVSETIPEEATEAAATSSSSSSGADPYHFLYLFDTVFLVDDSSSMMGRRWREVQSALRQMTPICTSHDDDGIDIYFMNHLNPSSSSPQGGYCAITDASQVDAIFQSVKPFGPTPTRSSIERILDPYFARLRAVAAHGDDDDVRPLNLIVLTDGMPGPPPSGTSNGFNPHLPEPAIVNYAHQLDCLRAPSYQVGIQFIQVGDDVGATRALAHLDCLRRSHPVRDMVDTTKCSDIGRRPLSADAILKAVLGGVDRRLDADSSSSCAASVSRSFGY
ncbi:hypothetical protein XA68_17425 [Ophiocordyceps unilateralis]|uniref:VWFA domain-containing protein n=1 Tax=Ophiocordyceps unilateralis TaxID=268505 RepID=A0A2A9P3I7_OPHUN|nr:hypothetical protein XA68_17425 [Ophiocordyceps unilateralis]